MGFHPNIAFTEGLAVALAPIERSISLDDGAAAILEAKRVSNIQNLFSPYFWKESGSRAYTIAGSMIQYLIQKHGFEGVKASYSGKSWKEAFGTSKKTTLANWKKHITQKFDKEKYQIYTEALYRHPGVLRSLCPHSKATLRRIREGQPWTRIRQPVGWNPAKDYWPWKQALNPNDLSSRLVSWRKEIKSVVNDIVGGQHRLETWQKVLEQARNSEPKVLEDLEIGILESDVLKKLGKTDKSLHILRRLEEFSKTHFINDGLQRKILARIMSEDLDSLRSAQVRMYLAGWKRKLPANTSATQQPWLLEYLKVRNQKQNKINYQQLVRLAQSQLDPNLSESFKLEWHRSIALRFMSYEKYHDAQTSWENAASIASSSKKEALQQHARKAKFYATLAPIQAPTTPQP